MNDLEASLRDALSARATTVTHDPAAYAAVAARRSRRRLWRVSSVGAAAATLVVVGVAVAAVRPTLPETHPAAATPPRMVAIVDGAAMVVAPDDLDRVFSHSVTPDHATTAVAAVGDGMRFFAADHRHRDCTTVLRAHRVDDSGSAVEVLPGTPRIAGSVASMAVSRDGNRLAYVLRPRDETGMCGQRGDQVRVRDVRSGAEKVWTDKDDPLYSNLGRLAWAPDDRYLSVGRSRSAIDTAGPGGTFELAGLGLADVTVGEDRCRVTHPVYRGATGGSAAFVVCGDGYSKTDGAAYEYDPASGTVGKRLFRPKLPARSDPTDLTFDSSGDHAFLEVVHGDPVPYRLYRWDHGKGVRFVDTGGRRFEQVRW